VIDPDCASKYARKFSIAMLKFSAPAHLKNISLKREAEIDWK